MDSPVFTHFRREAILETDSSIEEKLSNNENKQDADGVNTFCKKLKTDYVDSDKFLLGQ